MIRTGSRLITCNVWTDEAREAALEARRANAKGPKEPGPVERHVMAVEEREKAPREKFREEMAKDTAKGPGAAEKNYAALTPEEKAQYQKDYKTATTSTQRANDMTKWAEQTGKTSDHKAAAKMHLRAASHHKVAADTATSKEAAAAHAKHAKDHEEAARKHETHVSGVGSQAVAAKMAKAQQLKKQAQKMGRRNAKAEKIRYPDKAAKPQPKAKSKERDVEKDLVSFKGSNLGW